MRTPLFAVVALALPLGCGTSAPGPTGISVEGLEVAYARAACRSASRAALIHCRPWSQYSVEYLMSVPG